MPSAKELAKALARQDSVTQQPRNRFLGAIADAAGYVSDQADRYVVPERDPLFGGMRGGDLLPFRNVNRLLDDLSHGGRITTGRGQTTTLRPEVVDLAGVTGAMNPIGKAALREAAKQIHTGTGVLGRNVIDPRQRMFAGEGAKTADHGALKVAKDMKAAGVPDEAIHAKTKWTFGFADGKPRFEIDDSAAKGQFTHLQPSTDRLAEQAISHPRLYREYPELSQLNQLGLKEAKESGSFSPTFTNDKYSGGSILAKAPNEAGIKSVGLHELQHAIQQREGFASGGSPEMFKKYDQSLLNQENDKYALAMKELIRTYKESGKSASDAMNSPQGKILGESLNRLQDAIKSPYDSYKRLAGEAEARLTQSRMNMTAPERAASYPPSMFDVPVKDQIVRYGDNVGGAMMHRPKTEFEILHDTAQRNAALPVEQGGLGLPANNTYIDRANAPGMFPTDAYTGTNQDIRSLDPSKAKYAREGSGSWASENPEFANSYAGRPDGNVMPLRINTSKFGELDAANSNWNKIPSDEPIRHANGTDSTMSEYIESVFDDFGNTNLASNIARKMGDKGLIVNNVKDYGGYVRGAGDVPEFATNFAIHDPSQVRSRWAAFDPFRRHEADLLAGVGVGGMLDPQAIAEALRQQDRK